MRDWSDFIAFVSFAAWCLLIVVGPFMVWRMYRAVCGVERALWAIVSQLKGVRRELDEKQQQSVRAVLAGSQSVPVLSRMQREIPNSMFARLSTWFEKPL